MVDTPSVVPPICDRSVFRVASSNGSVQDTVHYIVGPFSSEHLRYDESTRKIEKCDPNEKQGNGKCQFIENKNAEPMAVAFHSSFCQLQKAYPTPQPTPP